MAGNTAARLETPYDVVTRTEVARPTAKSLLTALCRGLEREALGDPPTTALVTLQDARHLSPSTLEVYAAMARAGTQVTMLARGLRAWLAPGVAGVSLDDDDPLVDVWSMVLLHPRRPVALAALDLYEEGVTDSARPFRVAVTRDPETVQACGRALGAGAVSGGSTGGTTGA